MRISSVFLFFCLFAVISLESCWAVNFEGLPNPYPNLNGLAPTPSPLTNPGVNNFYGSVELPSGTLTFNSPQESNAVASTIFPCQSHVYRLAASEIADLQSGDYLHFEISIRNHLTGPSPTFTPLNLAFGEGNTTVYFSYDPTGVNPPVIQPYPLPIYSLEVYGENFDVTQPGYVWPGNQQFFDVPLCSLDDKTGYFWFVLQRSTDDAIAAVDYSFSVAQRRPAGSCDVFVTGTTCESQSITPIAVSSISTTNGLIAQGSTRQYTNDTRDSLLEIFDKSLGSTEVISEPSNANYPMYWRYFSVDLSAFSGTANYIVLNASQIVGEFVWRYQFGRVPVGGLFSSTLPLQCATSNLGPPGSYCSTIPEGVLTSEIIIDSCDIDFDAELYIGVLMASSFHAFPGGSQFGSGIRETPLTVDETSFMISVSVYAPVVGSYNLATPLDLTFTTLDTQYYTFVLNAADFGPRSTLTFDLQASFEVDIEVTYFEVAPSSFDLYCNECLTYSLNGECAASLTFRSCTGNLQAGTYFFQVTPAGLGSTMSLTATITEDVPPQILEAGVPLHQTLAPAVAEMNYVLNVPLLAEDRTWLYVELFTDYKFEGQNDIYVSMVSFNGEVFDGSSYSSSFCPTNYDWTCKLEDSLDTNSCYFFVDTCKLPAGPMLINVRSVSSSSNTYRPATSFTLWAEFDSAFELTNNVTYSDLILTNQYNHYYLVVDEVVSGSWLTVSVDNANSINEDITYNVFLNYGSLAGSCPCYDSLYNCTGELPNSCGSPNDNLPCNSLDIVEYPSDFDLTPPSTNDLSCCKLYATGCVFRAGTWYISVLAKGRSGSIETEYEVDVLGYTITAVIHPPPPVFDLPANTPVVDWVDNNQQNNYLLDLDFNYGADLVVSVTWYQDACFRVITQAGTGELDIDTSFVDELIEVRLNAGNLALPECYSAPWSCLIEGQDTTTSSCKIVVPNCEWSKLSANGPIFVSVASRTGDQSNTLYSSFTIEAHAELRPVTPLVFGTPITAMVSPDLYDHYSFVFDQSLYPTSQIIIKLYISNAAQLSENFNVFLQFDERVGDARECPDCGDYYTSGNCNDVYCYITLSPCDLADLSPNFYVAVYYASDSFFDKDLSYTLVAEMNDIVTVIDTTNYLTEQIIFDDSFEFNQQYVLNFPAFPTTASTDADTVSVTIYGATSEIYFNWNAKAGGNTCCFPLPACVSTIDGPSRDCWSDSDSESYEISASQLRKGETLYIGFNGVSQSFRYTIIITYNSAEIAAATTPTGTLSDGTQFNLGHESTTIANTRGFNLNYVDLGFANWNNGNNFDSWLTDNTGDYWNDANLILDQSLNAGQVRYYPVNVASGDLDRVYIGVDHVYSTDCPDASSVNVYYLGCGSLTTLLDFSTACQTQPGPGSLLFSVDSNTVSYGLATLDVCDSTCTSTHWVVVEAGNSSVNFDMRIFLQNPIELQTLAQRNTQTLNTTHPNLLTQGTDGQILQRFVISNLDLGTAVAPVLQITIQKNVNIPSFNIDFTVSANQANPVDKSIECCSIPTDCVEVRAGITSAILTNAASFTSPTAEAILGLSEVNSGIFLSNSNGVYDCGATDCLITIFPCGLFAAGSGADWYIDLSVDTTSSLDSVYSIFYTVLSDRFGSNDPVGVTQTNIAARAVFPPFASPASTLSEMDSFDYWEIDMTSYVPYAGNTPFRGRLEVQTWWEDCTDVGCVNAPALLTITNSDSSARYSAMPLIDSNLPTVSTINLDSYDNLTCCDTNVYTCFMTDTGIPGNSNCNTEPTIFVVPEAYLTLQDSYSIVIRLLAPGTINYRLQVRVVEPSCDPSDSRSCNNLGGFGSNSSNTINVDSNPISWKGFDHESSGIESASWVHHRFNLASYEESQTMVVIFQNDYTDSSDPTPVLTDMYLRLSYQGVSQSPDGQTNPLASLSGRDITGAAITDYPLGNTLPLEFSCHLVPVSHLDNRCIFQIPSSLLQTGTWFISIYNDVWYTDYVAGLDNPSDASVPARTDDYKGYNVTVYLKEFHDLAVETVTVNTDTNNFPDNGFPVGQCISFTSSPGVRDFGQDDADLISFNGYLSNSFTGVYEYHQIIVTETDLDLICTETSGDTCLFEHELQITVNNIDRLDTTRNGDINVLFYSPQSLNYNVNPTTGLPVSETLVDRSQYWNLGSHNADQELLCIEDNNVSHTYGACPGFFASALRPGTYYVIVQTKQDNDYIVCAALSQTDYITPPTDSRTPLTASATADYGDSQVMLLHNVVHNQIPVANSPGDSFFYYRIRIVDTDLQRAESPYLQFWLTDILTCTDTLFQACSTPVLIPTISVFRDDCQSWANVPEVSYGVNTEDTAATFSDFGALRRRVIDGEGLALCGLDTGSYFITVNSPIDEAYWTLQVVLRYPTIFPASAITPQALSAYIASPTSIPTVLGSIFQYQYQVYTLEIDTIDPLISFKSFTVVLSNIECGEIIMYLNRDSPGGPERLSSNTVDVSEIANFCSYSSASSTSSMSLSVDLSDIYFDVSGKANWYITLYGNFASENLEQTFRGTTYTPTGSDNNNLNAYTAPISYELYVIYEDYISQPESPFCSSLFLVTNSDPIEDYCGESTGVIDPIIQQFTWNVETFPRFSRMDAIVPGTANFYGIPSVSPVSTNFFSNPPSPTVLLNNGITDRNSACEQGPRQPAVAPIITETGVISLNRRTYFATTVEPGVTYYGSISDINDFAYFKLSTPASDFFQLSFESSDASSMIITYSGSDPESCCDSTWNPIPSDPKCITRKVEYLRVQLSSSDSCSCEVDTFSFSYTTTPVIYTLQCGETSCDPGNALYQFAEEPLGIWQDANDDWFAQIRSITNILGPLPGLNSDYCPTTCSDSTAYYVVDGGNNLEAVCNVVPIVNLLDAPLVSNPIIDTGISQYFRFNLPSTVDYFFSELNIEVVTDCGSSIPFYVRYEDIPSSDCTTLISTCNPLPGAYYIEIPSYASYKFNEVNSYEIFVSINTLESETILIDTVNQLTLLPQETKVYVLNAPASTPGDSLLVTFGFQSGPDFSVEILLSEITICDGFNNLVEIPDNQFPEQTGITFCAYEEGVYYTTISNPSNDPSDAAIVFSIFPYLVSADISPVTISIGTSSSPSISGVISFSHFERGIDFYQVSPSASNSLSTWAQFRLANVLGGELRLEISSTFFYPQQFLTSVNSHLYFSDQTIFNSAASNDSNCGPADFCSTSVTLGGDIPNNYGGSCVLILAPCDWNVNVEIQYLAISIELGSQSNPYQAVSYDLIFSEHVPLVLTSSLDTVNMVAFDHPSSFLAESLRQSGHLPGNVEAHFYSFSAVGQSARISVSVEGSQASDGVAIFLSSGVDCDICSTTVLWCGADYDQFLCEYEVAAVGDYQNGEYFLYVVPSGATSFSISATAGLQNCQFPEESGSLDFCSGLVDYPVWQWSTYATLDAEAECFYQSLVDDFVDPQCPNCLLLEELPFDCLQALQRFACYQSFIPCDVNGFQSSTCRAACQTVESQCATKFSSTSFGSYACTSSNYINDTQFPDLKCAGPTLSLTAEDTPADLPDFLSSFSAFQSQLLDQTVQPSANPDYGWNVQNE